MKWKIFGTKKDKSPITRTEFDLLAKRLAYMTGVNKKLETYDTLKEDVAIQIRIFNNELRTLNKRIDILFKKVNDLQRVRKPRCKNGRKSSKK